MDRIGPLFTAAYKRSGEESRGALAAARRAVELKPAQYHGWLTLSGVHSKMKNTAEAVKAMEKAIELAPIPSRNTTRRRWRS